MATTIYESTRFENCAMKKDAHNKASELCRLLRDWAACVDVFVLSLYGYGELAEPSAERASAPLGSVCAVIGGGGTSDAEETETAAEGGK